MVVLDLILKVSEKLLLIPFFLLLLASVFLSFKNRFVQIRMIPRMFRLLASCIFSKSAAGPGTVDSSKALFAAMTTSIGIGNIVAPVVAIGFGGPGALLGFILATFFGGASTYLEVLLAVKHRKISSSGQISGGSMEYIKDLVSPVLAHVYALFAFVLFAVWESNQSNTIACMMKNFGIPHFVSGLAMCGIIIFVLLGGIERVGSFAEKLVPVMFFSYSFAGLWIIFCNFSNLIPVICLVFKSAFSWQSLQGTVVGFSFYRAMRWGLAKGFYSNEAGLGTAPIPHSMAATSSPQNQAILALVSVYSNGFLCLISGLVVLTTGIWKNPDIPFGIDMIVSAFSSYFPVVGYFVLFICAVLFSFTTILGNGYNGSQCFLYSFGRKNVSIYYLLVAIMIFGGAICDMDLVWTITDFFVVPAAMINIFSLIYIAIARKDC
jgi:alanine or glycine:cation symporter, AGCS family